LFSKIFIEERFIKNVTGTDLICPDILKGSMAQTQNKNQKNPTHEKPVPATVLPNNLDTET
jgi:hypothetical protein